MDRETEGLFLFGGFLGVLEVCEHKSSVFRKKNGSEVGVLWP